VLDLANRHGLNWGTSESHDLMTWVGGHPYLVRVALYQLHRARGELRDLLKNAATDAGLFGDHLRRHLWNLHTYAELRDAMQRVVSSSTPLRLPSDHAFKLDSMGLVNRRGDDVSPRCELYRQYFITQLRGAKV
jgi:hypothetical protein